MEFDILYSNFPSVQFLKFYILHRETIFKLQKDKCYITINIFLKKYLKKQTKHSLMIRMINYKITFFTIFLRFFYKNNQKLIIQKNIMRKDLKSRLKCSSTYRVSINHCSSVLELLWMAQFIAKYLHFLV